MYKAATLNINKKKQKTIQASIYLNSDESQFKNY